MVKGSLKTTQVTILEEHLYPFPKNERCGSQVPAWHLNNCQYDSDKWRLGVELKWMQENLKKCLEASRAVISVNLETMDPLLVFLYLDHKVAYNNSKCNALYHNLKRAWRRWVMVTKVLTKLVLANEGTGDYEQDGGSYGVFVWEWYLSDGRIKVGGCRGFSSSGLQKNCRK